MKPSAPSFLASSSFARDRLIAQTSAPSACIDHGSAHPTINRSEFCSYLCKQDPEVPYPSEADNSDLLTRTGPVPNQWAVRRKTGTQHRSGKVGVQFFRNREHPALVRSDVAGIASLGDHPAVLLGPLTSIGVDHDDWAVSLVLVLTLLALAAGEGLCTNTDTLAFLDQRDLGAHAYGNAQDFMTNRQREMLGAPTTRDRMDVGTTDTASDDLDVDIVVVKGFQLEGTLVEFRPRLGAVDLESFGLFGVRHGADRDSDGFLTYLGFGWTWISKLLEYICST